MVGPEIGPLDGGEVAVPQVVGGVVPSAHIRRADVGVGVAKGGVGVAVVWGVRLEGWIVVPPGVTGDSGSREVVARL